MNVLDASGLPSLSMRHLADSLGVQPSALYWHFRDKQSLLAAVSERILSPVDVLVIDRPTGPASADPAPDTEPTGWEDAIRGVASTLHEALLVHRDGAELVSSSLALGLVRLPLADVLRVPLGAAGASGHVVAVVAETLEHFILGRTFDEQQRIAARDAGIEAGDAAAGTTDFSEGVDLIVAGTAVLISMDRGTSTN